MDYPEFLYVSENEKGMFVRWLCEEDPHALADIRKPRRQVGIYQLISLGEVVTSVAVEPDKK
jgi:hypothetical protein